MAYCSFLRVESPRPSFCPFPPAPSFPPPHVSSSFSYSRYFQLIQLTPSHSLSPFYIRPHFVSSIEPFLVFILSFASRRAAASFPLLFSLIFFLCHLPYRFLLFLRVPDLPTYLPSPPSTFLLPLDNPVLAILVLILSHSRSFSFVFYRTISFTYTVQFPVHARLARIFHISFKKPSLLRPPRRRCTKDSKIRRRRRYSETSFLSRFPSYQHFRQPR